MSISRHPTLHVAIKVKLPLRELGLSALHRTAVLAALCAGALAPRFPGARLGVCDAAATPRLDSFPRGRSGVWRLAYPGVWRLAYP